MSITTLDDPELAGAFVSADSGGRMPGVLGHALFPLEPVSDFRQRMAFDLGMSDAAAAKAHKGAWRQVVRVLSG